MANSQLKPNFATKICGMVFIISFYYTHYYNFLSSYTTIFLYNNFQLSHRSANYDQQITMTATIIAAHSKQPMIQPYLNIQVMFTNNMHQGNLSWTATERTGDFSDCTPFKNAHHRQWSRVTGWITTRDCYHFINKNKFFIIYESWTSSDVRAVITGWPPRWLNTQIRQKSLWWHILRVSVLMFSHGPIRLFYT